MQMKFRFQIFIVIFLMLGAQSVFSQETRYASDEYKIAFKIPKGFVKSAASTEREISYDLSNEAGAVLGTLQFMMLGDLPADVIAKLNESGGYDEAGERAFINGFIDGFAKGMPGAKGVFQEKERFELNDIKAFRFYFSVVMPDVKLRGASFVLPVTTQKRIYCFNFIAREENFDKLFADAEATVNSFERLKTGK